MYTLEKSINLVTGASPINNNLALLDVDENICADSLAVVNGGYINVIPILNPIRRSKYVSITTGEKRGKEQITEIKWLKINDENLFVVLSTIGLQIYDSELSDVRFHHCCKESGGSVSYTKGACVVRNAILCVGTNLGTIWMFKCDDSNTEFNVIDRFYAHDEAILCIDGYGSFLVSTSDKMTYVWNVQNEVKIAYCIMVPGLYAKPTTIKVTGIISLIGYESGEFCIFELLDETFYIRSVGHRLKITAIDFSPIRYLVLTASEDAYVKVWSYDQQTLQVNCVYSMFNEDGPLCGAMFLNLTATELCTVTVHDLNVRFYQKIRNKEEINAENKW